MYAIKDLTDLDPTTLFERYGTHYIQNAYLGGRIDYTSTIKKSSSKSAQQMKTDVEVTVKSVATNVSTSMGSNRAHSSSFSKVKLRVTGGNSQYANGISNYDAYKLWGDGIEGKPMLCDFNKTSLVPIGLFVQVLRVNNS